MFILIPLYNYITNKLNIFEITNNSFKIIISVVLKYVIYITLIECEITLYRLLFQMYIDFYSEEQFFDYLQSFNFVDMDYYDIETFDEELMRTFISLAIIMLYVSKTSMIFVCINAINEKKIQFIKWL